MQPTIRSHPPISKLHFKWSEQRWLLSFHSQHCSLRLLSLCWKIWEISEFSSAFTILKFETFEKKNIYIYISSEKGKIIIINYILGTTTWKWSFAWHSLPRRQLTRRPSGTSSGRMSTKCRLDWGAMCKSTPRAFWSTRSVSQQVVDLNSKLQGLLPLVIFSCIISCLPKALFTFRRIWKSTILTRSFWSLVKFHSTCSYISSFGRMKMQLQENSISPYSVLTSDLYYVLHLIVIADVKNGREN